MSWLIKPDRPKIRMSPRPITNGGVMIGSTVNTRRSRLALKPVRVTTRANARPSVVVVAAVSRASSSVFQPTPQLRPPVRQSSRQIFAANREAVARLNRAQQDARDREEREESDEDGDQHDRAGHEGVTLERAPRGEPQREEEQKARCDDHGARADAGLARDRKPPDEDIKEAAPAEHHETASDGRPVAPAERAHHGREEHQTGAE